MTAFPLCSSSISIPRSQRLHKLSSRSLKHCSPRRRGVETQPFVPVLRQEADHTPPLPRGALVRDGGTDGCPQVIRDQRSDEFCCFWYGHEALYLAATAQYGARRCFDSAYGCTHVSLHRA